MPKYLIERNVPNAGKMSAEELRGVAQKSNGVLGDLTRNGGEIQWVHSYVTGDAIHCIYEASDAEIVAEHARCGGFPADKIMEVQTMFDPTTGTDDG